MCLVARAVLEGCGEVGGLDGLVGGEVGDGAGEFEDAVEGAIIGSTGEAPFVSCLRVTANERKRNQ